MVSPTSRDSAVVSPIILRERESVRLVFKPMVVRNVREPEAALDGTFCYQRKRRADSWEDAEAISLSSLRAGEGMKLAISSSELLRLFRGLSSLYETAQHDGVPTGTRKYVQANPGSVMGDVARLVADGRAGDLLKTFLRWADSSQDALADLLGAVESDILINFDAAIAVTRLRNFLKDAEASLGNDDEDYWQTLLRREPWVISQLYAAPMVIIRDQAYVGGKTIDNRGGTVVDYMYRNALTQNSLIVEIKTPTTPLLTQKEYRNGVHGPSRELGGATQQLLHARQTLQEQYISLTGGGRTGFNVFGTRALLVVGTLPEEPVRIRSFEVYRNAQRGIEIVTFDEMIAKGRVLIDALSQA
ncbi:MAG: Shedu immune nuclease family protein [Jatrophihabitantaceae bacterium]